MSNDHPVRVLHVIGALNRGGTETWLVNVLKHVDRRHVAMDFLVQQPGDPGLEAEVRSLGAEIYICPRNLSWLPRLLRILKTCGPYDVLHSHRNAFGAVVLAVGKVAGIRTLIAHSHTSIPLSWTPKTAVRMVLIEIARMTINRVADVRIGASEGAAQYLFGRFGESTEDPKVIYCGIDITPLSIGEDRRIDIQSKPYHPSRRKTLGHVGAFKPVKNHFFLLEVLQEMLERDPEWQLLLIGDGPMLQDVVEQTRQRHLDRNLVFLGSRDDVLKVLSRDVDVFILPSKFEGLGLAAVEAQLAGVPSVVSSAVPPEAVISPGIVRSLPLTASPAEWAEMVLQLSRESQAGRLCNEIDQEKARRFDIEVSAKALEDLYVSVHPTRVS